MSRRPFFLSLAIIFLMGLVSVWAWLRLPTSEIAVRFSAGDRPDGYMEKSVALLALPAIALAGALVMAALPTWRSLQARLQASAIPYSVNWIGGLTVLAIMHAMLVAKACGAQVDIPRGFCFLVGLLAAVIGNFYGKIRYNYVFGLRTPWTLASERVWDKTHRFFGRAMLFSGLVLFVASLIVSSTAALSIIMGVLLGVPLLLAVIYSALIPGCPDTATGAVD